jgi:hypothetical protein
MRLGGRCQWVLDATFQVVEWPVRKACPERLTAQSEGVEWVLRTVSRLVPAAIIVLER